MGTFEHRDVRAAVLEMVEAILAKSGNAGQVDCDAALADAGMTSMDMVNLMMDLEARFDLMIPAECLTPDRFRSVSSIAAMICSLGEGGSFAHVA